jgi:hypothetical protein
VRYGARLLRDGLMAVMLMAVTETLPAIERRLEGIDRQIVGAGREDATCRHLITAGLSAPALGKLARIGWALMTRHEDYCNRPAAA